MSRRVKNSEVRETRSVNGSPLTDQLFERISRRAYELYQLRGASHGQDTKDWFEAERQIEMEAIARPREQD